MNRSISLARALRFLAIAIAIAGALDPAVTSDRRSRPDLAVVASDPVRDSLLVTQVAAQLGSGFTVTSAPFPGAAATVLVGTGLPESLTELNGPVFAVTPDPNKPSIRIVLAEAPRSMLLDSRVRIVVEARTTGLNGRKLSVALRLGSITVDRRDMAIRSADTTWSSPMTFAPTAVGPAALRVVATTDGGGAADSVDLAISVRNDRWSVLFYDTRPSWQATFVRRAVESDGRFDVTSRVVTSKNISTDLGAPPASLDNAAGLDRYDAIIIGAPELLTDRDVAGLDAYLRRRAGGVLLVPDEQPAGPVQRLIGVTTWNRNRDGKPVDVGMTDSDSSYLRASELIWPAELPPGALERALAPPPGHGKASDGHPILWFVPVGAGTITFSGALDAWRFRDSTVSGFDQFWRNLIADLATTSARPLNIIASQSVAAPGEPLDLTAELRDAALRPLPARASITATIDTIGAVAGDPVRLWPLPAAGKLRGTIRAPDRPGAYQLSVAAADGNRRDEPFIVATGARHAGQSDQLFLAGWVATRGGRAFGASQLSALPAALRSAVHPAARRERWHPLRSAWWLLPFALALSAEWWLRRRRGLA